MTKEEIEVLKKFFSAYFHEDWSLDSSDTADVVKKFTQDATADEIQRVSCALGNYLATFSNDEQLETRLFKELGCYYIPTADGLSAVEWLKMVRIGLNK